MDNTKRHESPNALDAYIGEIQMIAFTRPPRGWMLCKGQSLNKAQYSQLFELIGYSYGGSGDIFYLPDLQGKFPLGLSNDHTIGSSGGMEKVTLEEKHIPVHTHISKKNQVIEGKIKINASDSTGDSFLAVNSALGQATKLKFPQDTSDRPLIYTQNPLYTEKNQLHEGTVDTSNATISSVELSNYGKGEPLGIMPPYLTINFMICVEGLFPSPE